MNDKPLDTPITGFSQEEIAAMDSYEATLRQVHLDGGVTKTVMLGVTDRVSEMMGTIEQGEALAGIGMPGELVAEIVGQQILAMGGDLVQLGRDIERAVRDNPELAAGDLPVEWAEVSEMARAEREAHGAEASAVSPE